MNFTLNLQQAADLDLILKSSLMSEGVPCSVEQIHQDLLPERDYNYCLSLFYILRDYHPSLLWPASGPDVDCFWANEYSNAFLHYGGFQKIFNDELSRVKKEESLNVLNQKKLAAEIEIAHFQKGVGRKITIWGFVIAAISAVGGLASSHMFPDRNAQERIQQVERKLDSLQKVIEAINHSRK